MCNMTWDGWLCWDESEPGEKEQNCPGYYKDFDTQGEFLSLCAKTCCSSTDAAKYNKTKSKRIKKI